MSTLTIASEADWTVIATLLTAGNLFTGTVKITADFSFTTSQNPLYLNNGVIVDGQCHTLTLAYGDDYPALPVSTCNGLFVFPITGPATTEVKNLTLNAGNKYCFTSSGFIIDGQTYYSDQRGQITNVHLIGGYSDNGSFLTNTFGDSSNLELSVLTKCSSTITLNQNSGFGSTTYNTSFISCYYNGVAINGYVSGSVNIVNGDLPITFENCYSNLVLNNDNMNGFVNTLNNLTMQFKKCYHLGNITSPTGFCSGFVSSSSALGTLSFDDCYHIGSINNVDSYDTGFLITSQGTVNLTNCYSTADQNGTLIFYNAGSTITLTNCHTLNGFYQIQSTSFTDGTTDDLDTVVYPSGTLPSGWSSSIWTKLGSSVYPAIGGAPILNTFQDTSVWDGTYLFANNTPDFAAALCALVPCFEENTPIETSRGIKMIQSLKRGDVVDGYEIDMVIRSDIAGKQLIKIEKDALGTNMPTQDTFVTRQHLFQVNGKPISAGHLSKMYPSKIYQVQPNHKFVYHIVLKNRQYAFITVNGLKAETLGIMFQDKITRTINKQLLTV